MRDIFFRSTSESSEMAILRPRARRGLLATSQSEASIVEYVELEKSPSEDS